MKREIKFRAWDKDKKQMFNVTTLFSISEGKAQPWVVDNGMYRPKNFVLEQYTGLKDKNGREIYEGDIVRCSTWHDGEPTGVFQGEVVYSGDLGMASFDIRLDHDGEIDRAVLPAIGVEIIGNAFENPELLEVEK